VFFAHWSNTESSYRDMERRQLECPRCEKETEQTFRYHISKTKHYSVVSIGEGEKAVTVICHGCLLERPVDKEYAKELMVRYDNEITVAQAHELMERGDNKKAEKILKKLLKKFPKYGPGLYAISKSLISQTKYAEAEFYVKNLEIDYPEDQDVVGLRKLMP